MAPTPLDDEHAPLYTVGQVAEMLDVQPAFLRRLEDHRVVQPSRSSGGKSEMITPATPAARASAANREAPYAKTGLA